MTTGGLFRPCAALAVTGKKTNCVSIWIWSHANKVDKARKGSPLCFGEDYRSILCIYGHLKVYPTKLGAIFFFEPHQISLKQSMRDPAVLTRAENSK